MSKDNNEKTNVAPAQESETVDAPSPESTEQTLDAVHVIERFGGIRPMASKIDVAVTTVQGWKNRGVIPESRRDAIETAAAKHGVDLDTDAQEPSPGADDPIDSPDANLTETETETSPSSTETSAASSSQTRSGGGLAWVAIVASLAALTLASHPYWGPQLGVQLPLTPPNQPTAAPTPIPTTLPDTEARTQIKQLTSRIGQLEKALHDAADKSTSTPSPALLTRLNAMEAKLDAQPETTESSIGASFQAAISAMEARVDAAEKTLLSSSEERAQLKNALATATENTTKRATELAARFDAIKVTQGVVAGANAATLGLSINGLDAALAIDKNFALALSTTKAALKDAIISPDAAAALNAIVASLEPIAATGAPSLATLTRQFDALAPTLARRESVGEKSDWVERSLDKLYDVVAWRRIDGPVERAAQALASRDLPAAVTILSTDPTTETLATGWINDARKRIATDTARNALKSAAIATQLQAQRQTSTGAQQ